MTSYREMKASLTGRVRNTFAEFKIYVPEQRRRLVAYRPPEKNVTPSSIVKSMANGILIDTPGSTLPISTLPVTPPVQEKPSTCIQKVDPSNSSHTTTSSSNLTKHVNLNSTSQRTRSTELTLLSLPTELIQYIGSYLNPSTIEGSNEFWLLRLTCTRLYAILGAPTYYLTARHLSDQMLKVIIPGDLAYCEECKKFHPRRPGDTYTFDDNRHVRCLRFLRNSGKSEYAMLGRQYYVCETCYSRRYRRYCKGCKICEICTGLQFTLESGLVLDGREKKGEPESEYCDDCWETRRGC